MKIGDRVVTKDGYDGVITAEAGTVAIEEPQWSVKMDSGLTQRLPESFLDLESDLKEDESINEEHISQLRVEETHGQLRHYRPSGGTVKWFRDELGTLWVKFRAVGDDADYGEVTHVIPNWTVRAVTYEVNPNAHDSQVSS